jgi:hypothetical protein
MQEIFDNTRFGKSLGHNGNPSRDFVSLDFPACQCRIDRDKLWFIWPSSIVFALSINKEAGNQT